MKKICVFVLVLSFLCFSGCDNINNSDKYYGKYVSGSKDSYYTVVTILSNGSVKKTTFCYFYFEKMDDGTFKKCLYDDSSCEIESVITGNVSKNEVIFTNEEVHENNGDVGITSLKNQIVEKISLKNKDELHIGDEVYNRVDWISSP